MENRFPAKPGLKTVQQEELEMFPFIMNRNAPFQIVILNHKRITCRPLTCGWMCS